MTLVGLAIDGGIYLAIGLLCAHLAGDQKAWEYIAMVLFWPVFVILGLMLSILKARARKGPP